MWFTKLLLFLGFKNKVIETETISKHKPNRQLCQSLLEGLETDNFKHYLPIDGLLNIVCVHYNNIELYTKKLKEVTRDIKQNKLTLTDLSIINESTLSIDRFFISSNGYYVDPVRAVNNFKEAGLAFCLCLETTDTEHTGYSDYSLRMCTKLLINLKEVTIKLNNVSLKK